jgi:hypothetical protein
VQTAQRHAGESLIAYRGYLITRGTQLVPQQGHLFGIATKGGRSTRNAIIAKQGDVNMIRRTMFSTALAVSVAVAALMLTTSGSASGQHEHGQQQGQQQASTQQHQHGGMMHSEQEMKQMMSHMAQDPAMLKSHLKMMLASSEIRPVLVKVLKDDDDLRLQLDKLLSEARQ